MVRRLLSPPARTRLTLPSCVRSFQMRDALRVGSIVLSDQFFSCMMQEVDAIKAIRDELCRFAIVTEAPKTLFGKVRKTYTGKLGGQQDDLAIALCVPRLQCLQHAMRSDTLPPRRQLAITGIRCFYQSKKYDNFREEW